MIYILLLIIIALLVYHINFSPTRKKKMNEENLRKTLDYLKGDMFDQDNENVKQTIKNIEDSLLGPTSEQSLIKKEKPIEDIRKQWNDLFGSELDLNNPKDQEILKMRTDILKDLEEDN